MAICRTINPFTCRRDLYELDMLVLNRTDVMLWIQLAKEARHDIRELRHLGYTDNDTCIKNATDKYKLNMQVVSRRLDEYRFRCQCAKMNINEAVDFRKRLREYLEEN